MKLYVLISFMAKQLIINRLMCYILSELFIPLENICDS